VSQLLTLREAAKLFSPSRDKATHPSTLSRWITVGCPVGDGRFVRLKAARFPSGWRVTEEAVADFIQQLTAAALGEDVEPEARPTKARQAELARVDAEIARLGL
jgi:hypothetical protein